MSRTVHSAGIPTRGLAAKFVRADIEFHGVDHAGPSFEGRVYLNSADADESTPRSAERGYAGSFHIFGHGGCLGDVGHCDVKPRRDYDPRPAHPLTPARKVVIATEAVRRALAAGGSELTVSVVPVIVSTTPKAGRPEDVLKYETVRIVTYE